MSNIDSYNIGMTSRVAEGTDKTRGTAITGLIDQVARVIIGKRESIKFAVTALLSGGHLLIEDVPGVGKTALAKAIAKSTSCKFKRIQFTPDLLPSDIVGLSIYEREKGELVFKHGPIFAHIILADEINRTSPRTQSALLEAMNEQRVTVDGVTYKLPEPFMVIATQNPFEFAGTYPLPESQLDRFMMSIRLGYPGREEEKEVVASRNSSDPIKTLESVMSEEEIAALIGRTSAVRIAAELSDYIIAIVDSTRHYKDVLVGVSPRGSIHLTKAAQAYAVIDGRDYVVPDDIKRLAPHVLAHRLMLKRTGSFGEARMQRTKIIDAILDSTPVPQ